MNIAVTQGDIDSGRKFSASFCPIARAVRRATGRFVQVGRQSVHIAYGNDGTSVTSYALPSSGQVFIEAFDNSKPVGPFEFELTALADQDEL